MFSSFYSTVTLGGAYSSAVRTAREADMKARRREQTVDAAEVVAKPGMLARVAGWFGRGHSISNVMEPGKFHRANSAIK